MNSSQVQEMIGHGFQLGLHGHQHVSGALTQYVHLDERRAMAVVSAGSLCAGSNQLPRGVNRQYNLIVVEDDFLSARVHVPRKWATGEQFTRKRTGAFLDGFLEVSWQPQTNMMGTAYDPQESNVRRALEDAEFALKNGKASEALETLRGVDIDSQPYARKLKIEALTAEGKWLHLMGAIGEPVNVEERVLLISALVNANHLEDAQRRLDEETEIDPTTQRSLQERLDARRMMRQS